MHFLKVRRSRESGTRFSSGFHSPFRLSPKVLHVNVRWAIANHTFSSHPKSLNWHFLAWHKPLLSQCSTAQAWNPQGISKLVNKGWLLLVWQSFWMISQALFAVVCVPVGSLHFVQFDSANPPCNGILCSGFLNRPLPFGMHLKVSPKGCISLIGCSTQLPRSAVGVTHVSWGWSLNIPLLRSSWSSGFLRRFSHDNPSEQSLLEETFQGTLRGTPQVTQ